MRRRVYGRGPDLRGLLRALVIALAALVLLAAVAFFLLKSWTVYDAEGAHIVFPWSERS